MLLLQANDTCNSAVNMSWCLNGGADGENPGNRDKLALGGFPLHVDKVSALFLFDSFSMAPVCPSVKWVLLRGLASCSTRGQIFGRFLSTLDSSCTSQKQELSPGV